MLAALALALPVTGCATKSSDPATMDKQVLVETILTEGALSVFKAPGAGEMIQATAALPQATKGYLITTLESKRRDLGTEAAFAEGAEQERLDAEYDWVDANLRCINTGDCADLHRLQASRKAAAVLAQQGGDSGDSGGHSD